VRIHEGGTERAEKVLSNVGVKARQASLIELLRTTVHERSENF
jgi:hypothetical protein